MHTFDTDTALLTLDTPEDEVLAVQAEEVSTQPSARLAQVRARAADRSRAVLERTPRIRIDTVEQARTRARTAAGEWYGEWAGIGTDAASDGKTWEVPLTAWRPGAAEDAVRMTRHPDASLEEYTRLQDAGTVRLGTIVLDAATGKRLLSRSTPWEDVLAALEDVQAPQEETARDAMRAVIDAWAAERYGDLPVRCGRLFRLPRPRRAAAWVGALELECEDGPKSLGILEWEEGTREPRRYPSADAVAVIARAAE